MTFVTFAMAQPPGSWRSIAFSVYHSLTAVKRSPVLGTEVVSSSPEILPVRVDISDYSRKIMKESGRIKLLRTVNCPQKRPSAGGNPLRAGSTDQFLGVFSMRDQLTLQRPEQHAGGTTTGLEGSGVLVLPGLQEGLVLPSLPGALCKGEDPGTWFPPGTSRIAIWKAKRVCTACPVRVECLRWALEAGEMGGVWGGATPPERREIRRLGPAGSDPPEPRRDS